MKIKIINIRHCPEKSRDYIHFICTYEIDGESQELDVGLDYAAQGVFNIRFDQNWEVMCPNLSNDVLNFVISMIRNSFEIQTHLTIGENGAKEFRPVLFRWAA